MKKFFKWLVIIIVIVGAAFALGPRPDNMQQIAFAESEIGEDLDAYLAKSEAEVPGIIAGAEKEIIWADPASKSKTPLAIVYLHGFSASKYETRPLSDNIARALSANLYYARLEGHGQEGDALGEATLQGWTDDVVEAIAIGQRIGDKVVIISASTGATLATWAASVPDLANKLTGMVLISPNYAIHGAGTGLMNMPWAETLLPMLMGQRREWEPSSAEHGKWWTTSYPSKAVFPMGALLKNVEAIDKGAINVPTLFMFSTKDTVVVPEVTQAVADAWGGPKQVVIVDNSDDDGNHVIAGDIRSPSTTEQATQTILDWIGTL